MKLVRDNIPQIAPHRKFVQIHDLEEILHFTSQKLGEKTLEVQGANTPAEITEELADLLEVMLKYAKERGIDWDAVLEAGKKKNTEKDKFEANWIML